MDLTGSIVTLDRIITHRKEFICIDDLHSYKRCRVQCNVKGIVLRDTVLGADIKTKKQQVCKVNDFLVAEIDAKMGGFGIVSEDLEGAIVSSHYFLYEVNKELVDRKFLDFYIRTPSFINQVSAQGSTNYAAIRSEEVLQYQIPLPSLEEQRRIVGRIEELAGKIAEARGLRESAIEETKLLLDAALKYIFDKSSTLSAIQLNDVAEINRGKFAHRPRNDPRFYNGNIPFIQIGDISNSAKYIREYSQTLNEEGLKISRIFPHGTIVIAITGATIGATGILTFESCFPDSIVGINSKSDKITTEYIYWSLEHIKKDMLSEATQTTQPNINLQHFAKLRIVVPPLSEQKRIVEYLDKLQSKIDTLKQLRQETLKELDALLPAILDKAFKGKL